MRPEEIVKLKALLPTSLGSEEIREKIAADILRRSLFSARMTSASYLARLREVLTRFTSGAINAADARAALLKSLETMGYSPQDEGGLKNPASIRRLNLILDTNKQMASSVATLSEQTEATVAMYPAWELTRMGVRRAPREDWARRWKDAGDSVGWEGAVKSRMIALKSSPIWAALGNGAGGYTDTLGNPYPPFAFSSGLDWVEVSAEEAAALGLDAEAAFPSRPSLSPGEKDIADAEKRYGFDFKGVLKELA